MGHCPGKGSWPGRSSVIQAGDEVALGVTASTALEEPGHGGSGEVQ